jgi:hypothetical protein
MGQFYVKIGHVCLFVICLWSCGSDLSSNFYFYFCCVEENKENVPPNNLITWHIIVIVINLINELELILLILNLNDLNKVKFTYPFVIKLLFDRKLPNVKFNHGTNASVNLPKVFVIITSSLHLKLRQENEEITNTKMGCSSLA